jgi:hypothetical protein
VAKANLWAVVAKLNKELDEEIVFIGGVAVYAYTLYSQAGILPEMTHDVDAAITISASAQLRDDREGNLFVKNARLKKAQVTMDGVDVDIYIEHQNNLRFDYPDLAMYANTASVEKAHDFRLASLPHLLFLKIEAYRSRAGEKDQRDIAKILVLLDASENQGDFDLVLGNITKTDHLAISRIIKSSAFMEIARNNAQAASKLRARAQNFIDRVKRGSP